MAAGLRLRSVCEDDLDEVLNDLCIYTRTIQLIIQVAFNYIEHTSFLYDETRNILLSESECNFH